MLTLNDLQVIYQAYNTSPDSFQPTEPLGQLLIQMSLSLDDLRKMGRAANLYQTDAYWIHRALLLGYLIGSNQQDAEDLIDFCQKIVWEGVKQALKQFFLSRQINPLMIRRLIRELTDMGVDYGFDQMMSALTFVLNEGPVTDSTSRDVRGILMNEGITADSRLLQAIHGS